MKFGYFSRTSIYLGALVCGAFSPVHSNAGLLDKLVGGSAPCEITDETCVIDLYSEAIIERAQEDDDQAIYAARAFARQSAQWREATVENVLSEVNLAGGKDAFQEAYEAEVRLIEAESHLSYEGIERAVYDAVWPKSMEWSTFITKAVLSVLNDSPDAKKLHSLWMQDQAFFEEYASNASVEIMVWGLTHHPEETISFLNSDHANDNVAKRGLRGFVDAITLRCSEGKWEHHQALRESHKAFKATQKYTANGVFLPYVDDAYLAIYCDSQAEADAAFEALETVVNDLLASQEPSFETGLVYDGLEEVSRYYAVKLSREGEEEAALDILKRGASRGWTVASGYDGDKLVEFTVWDILVQDKLPELRPNAIDFMKQQLDAFKKMEDEQVLYGGSSEERLAYFQEVFDPQFEICCIEEDHLEDMLELVEKAAPNRDVHDLSAKLLALMERYEQRRDEPLSTRAEAELSLAVIERRKGCIHQQKTVERLFSSAVDVEYPKERAQALANFLNYMNVQPSEKTASACLFE